MKIKLILLAVLGLALILRVWGLLTTPTGLYWEEVALGYDAWSLATTGKDVHGNLLPLVAVESFGDYKPSGYFYALVPWLWVFGPQDFVIKLPSLLAGLAIVWGTGRLVMKARALLGLPRQEIWRIVAMLIAVVNPALWHLARIGFETNLATALLLWGVILLLPAKKPGLTWHSVLGEILLIASFYTYHSLRLVAPLLGVFLLAWQLWLLPRTRRFAKRQLIPLLTMIAVALVAVLPFAVTPREQITTRFGETSVFAGGDSYALANECREVAGASIFAKIFCHRYFYQTGAVIANWLDHFRVDYLFLTGDTNRRHSLGLFGVFYPFEVVLLGLGVVVLYRLAQRQRTPKLPLVFGGWWLLVGILPASLTLATPHLLRSENIIPLLIVIACLGVAELKRLSTKISPAVAKVVLVGLVVCYLGGATAYANFYHGYYRRAESGWWQAGYREAMLELARLQQTNPQLGVGITRDLGRPSVYYWWYRRVAPALVQAQAGQEKMDQGEFLSYSPDGITFGGINYDHEQLLLITLAEEAAVLERGHWLARQEIFNPAEEVVLVVGHFSPH